MKPCAVHASSHVRKSSAQPSQPVSSWCSFASASAVVSARGPSSLSNVVPLAAVFDWARPQSLPVTVIPGAGHFFHGQLGLLKNVLVQQLRMDYEVREVKIPVAVACAADPGPDPTYPDTDEALRNVPDVATGVRLITAGRLLRDARIGELKAALAGCAAPP